MDMRRGGGLRARNVQPSDQQLVNTAAVTRSTLSIGRGHQQPGAMKGQSSTVDESDLKVRRLAGEFDVQPDSTVLHVYVCYTRYLSSSYSIYTQVNIYIYIYICMYMYMYVCLAGCLYMCSYTRLINLSPPNHHIV